MIKLESLRGGENRSNHQAQAKSAYQALCLLAEKGRIQLEDHYEIRFRKDKMNKSGYKGIDAVFVVINRIEGNNFSQIGYCAIAEQGAAYFDFPESIFVDGVPREQLITNNDYFHYATQFAPEASKPLADWFSSMKDEGKYLPKPPRFNLPNPTM